MEKTAATNPFTSFYGQLQHQGNMLQDLVRTSAYQQFVLENAAQFKDKVVLDVGTGTGILAFFAAQAGARKVYAVDASEAASIAKILSDSNGFSDRVIIIRGKIEELRLPERVDIIISEPIGFLLVHERMLESFVLARDRFLKHDGCMFPTVGSIVFAPLTDEGVFKDQCEKMKFWSTTDFYGVDLSAVKSQARDEYFGQPIVGTFPIQSLLSTQRAVHTIDFNSVTKEELQSFEIPFSFRIDVTAVMHGFGCWFDIGFTGEQSSVALSTAPDQPTTHWYQCRLLLRRPIAVNEEQYITGSLKFCVNERFSYTIEMDVQLEGTTLSTQNTINLHDQIFSY